MPTRFYFSSNSGSFPKVLTPTAGWELQTTYYSAKLMRASDRSSSSFSNWAIAETSTSPTYDVLIGQFVSDPISSQIITGTVKAIVRTMESATAADMRPQMTIRVMADGGNTVRGTLLDFDAAPLVSEFDATNFVSRKYPVMWTTSSLTLVTSSIYDRIVVELGYRSINSSATSYSGTIVVGDASSTDLPEDETTSTANSAWIEFSQLLHFVTASTAVGGRSTNNTTNIAENSEASEYTSYADDSTTFPTVHTKTYYTGSTFLGRPATFNNDPSEQFPPVVSGGGTTLTTYYKLRAIDPDTLQYVYWVTEDPTDWFYNSKMNLSGTIISSITL